MAQYTIDKGETVELATLNRFEILGVQPTGGDIRLASGRAAEAQRGELIQDGDRGQEIAFSPSETIYARAEADGVTVRVRKQGFLNILLPRTSVDTDITAQSVGDLDINLASVGVTTVPISIDAQTLANLDINLANVGVSNVPVDINAQSLSQVDFNLAASAITQDIDITAQSVGDINQRMKRNEAQGFVEVNEDQTTDITAGDTDRSTRQADTSEVWVLRSFRFELTNTSGSTVEPNVTVQSETQNIEYAFAAVSLSDGESLFYDSAGWRTTASSFIERRDAIKESYRIDDNNGVEVVVGTGTAGNNITDNRTIRFGFDVIRA